MYRGYFFKDGRTLFVYYVLYEEDGFDTSCSKLSAGFVYSVSEIGDCGRDGFHGRGESGMRKSEYCIHHFRR